MTDELEERLAAAVSAQVVDGTAWAVDEQSPDRMTVTLPDRTIAVRRRDGPDGVDHWTLELTADGAIVGKFGPFDAVDAVTERVGALLDSDVRYTVCCDG